MYEEDSIDYGMDDEDASAQGDSQEAEEETQPTQSTQQASQPPDPAVDSHIWGFLQPCSVALTRIDFWRIHPRYTIGRNIDQNQVVLPGPKISECHTARLPPPVGADSDAVCQATRTA